MNYSVISVGGASRLPKIFLSKFLQKETSFSHQNRILSPEHLTIPAAYNTTIAKSTSLQDQLQNSNSSTYELKNYLYDHL